MEAPPAQPRFDFGPPPSPPPVKAPPGQRRFNFLFVVLTILVAIALVGGLLLFGHRAKKPSPAAQEKAAVEAAYLHYDNVANEAFKTLDSTALAPLMSAPALQQEQTQVLQAAQSGYRYLVTSEHDMQTVVYSENSLASIDDLLLRHTVKLDRSTSAPVDLGTSNVLDLSIVLRRATTGWTIDSIAGFGAGSSESGSGVSYAAAHRSQPLSASEQGQIVAAYAGYWVASERAASTASAAPLAAVEVDPELAQDSSLMDQLKKNGEVVKPSVQHNYRVAEEDSSTFWVYDTFADSSRTYYASTGELVGSPSTQIIRKSFRFKSEGANWKVDFVILDN